MYPIVKGSRSADLLPALGAGARLQKILRFVTWGGDSFSAIMKVVEQMPS
jgi:hypothetical protein